MRGKGSYSRESRNLSLHLHEHCGVVDLLMFLGRWYLRLDKARSSLLSSYESQPSQCQ